MLISTVSAVDRFIENHELSYEKLTIGTNLKDELYKNINRDDSYVKWLMTQDPGHIQLKQLKQYAIEVNAVKDRFEHAISPIKDCQI